MLEDTRERKDTNGLLQKRRNAHLRINGRNFFRSLILFLISLFVDVKETGVIELKYDRYILQYMPTIREVAEELSLNPNIIAAIIITESTGKTCAMRFEPGWRWFTPTEHMMAYAEKLGCSVQTEENGQATSWGLMQVMGTVAREHGFRGWFSELCQPETGIRYGANHLR